jgi:hypothetical protein
VRAGFLASRNARLLPQDREPTDAERQAGEAEEPKP